VSAWAWLAGAIAAEITATSALKLSDGFQRLLPSAVVALGYAAAFYGLSMAVRTLPLGIVYAVWSGIGTVGAILVGRWLFGESLGLLQYLGVVLVLGGVVLINASREGVF